MPLMHRGHNGKRNNDNYIFDSEPLPPSQGSFKNWQCYCITALIAILFLILLACSVVIGVYIGYGLLETSANKTDEYPGTKTTIRPSLKPEELRLPKNLRPIKYFLKIQSFMPSNSTKIPESRKFTFQGNLIIFLRCKESTDRVVLNLAELEIDNKSITIVKTNEHNNISYGAVSITGMTIKNEEKMVEINLGQDLLAENFYSLNLNYSGPISTKLAGYFRSSYKENGETKWLSTTQFSPIDARKAFPCFDEPEFKAIFNIEMVHPNNYKAISNGKETTSEDLGHGWRLTKFEPSPIMSTYIVGFTLCEFEHLDSQTSNGVQFRVWARKSLISQTQFVAKWGPKFLEFQENYFGVKFPLKKQDMIAIPDFEVAAMENWGMINFRESILLYNKTLKSSQEKCTMASTMAHELAHMWFGNLVTMQWFSDVWLKEGFASIMESITLDALFNDSFNMRISLSKKEIQSAMVVDQLATSHPLSVKIERAYEVYEIFDTITYTKSLAVIIMVKEVIGEDNFKLGLNKCLEKFQYENAQHNDVWDAISEAVYNSSETITDWDDKPLNVSTFAAPWTLQMGFPVVTLEQKTDGSLYAYQKRFRLDPEKQEKEKYKNPPFGYKWYIPLWLKTSNWSANSDNKLIWLTPEANSTISVNKSANWYVIDSGSKGYYRVNYDAKNWEAIADQLKTNHHVISPETRSQLIDDSFTFAQAGLLNYSVPLSLTSYLAKEHDNAPFQTVINKMYFIEIMFALTPGFGKFKEYMLSLLTPLYQKYGWAYTVPDNSFSDEEYNAGLIESACKFGHKKCIEFAANKFSSLVKNCSTDSLSSSCNKLPPQFRSLVYCTGVQTKGLEAWDFLWSKAATEQLASETKKIYWGLACSGEPWLINKLLHESLNGTTIRQQDIVYIFNYVSQHPIGMELLWSFFSRNWKQINLIYGESLFSIGSLISLATTSFNTDYQIEQLKHFLASHPGTSKFSKFHSQLEKAEGQSQWMKLHYRTLLQWFEKSLTNQRN